MNWLLRLFRGPAVTFVPGFAVGPTSFPRPAPFTVRIRTCDADEWDAREAEVIELRAEVARLKKKIEERQ